MPRSSTRRSLARRSPSCNRSWTLCAGLYSTQALFLLLECARLWGAFWAFHEQVSLTQTAALLFAYLVGSLITIVPGGLGIREGTGVLIGSLVGLAPALCFSAMALNWLLAASALALAAAVIALRRGANAP